MNIDKETIFRVYIVENNSFDKTFQILGITRNQLRRFLTKYHIKKDKKMSAKNNTHRRTPQEVQEVARKGVETQRNAWSKKTETEIADWQNKCRKAQLQMPEDKKKQKANKYREWWDGLTNEQREEINSRRRDACLKVWKNNTDLLNQRSQTSKQNRLNRKDELCRTKSEQIIYNCLIKVYPDLQYDVRVDDRYPFFCDFYIPSEDLFIEYQGHPSHGRLPMKYLSAEEYTKYPSKWQDVFANRDIIKESYIEKNKLNFVRFYPRATMNENLWVNGSKYHELIEKLIKLKL